MIESDLLFIRGVARKRQFTIKDEKKIEICSQMMKKQIFVIQE